MARSGPSRLALGLALGAAAAAGLGLSLLWALRRRRRGWRRGGGSGREAARRRPGGTAGLGDGGAEVVGSWSQGKARGRGRTAGRAL